MTMANSVKGSAVYKKKDGTLSISKDQKTIVWLPLGARDFENAVTIAISNISNLQQTPESSPKVILRIIEKPLNATDAVNHQFAFNSPSNPRGEANSIKEVLTRLISIIKANDPNVPKPNGTGTPAAMAAANAVPFKPGAMRWYDDVQLKADFELQQRLLSSDPALKSTYLESRRTKPETISDSQFNTQFWSTRITMLRAYAVEHNQQRGAYNALSVLKPRQVNGELKMNISAEQVQLVFSQHPLVKRVYDENVPKLSEMEFWSRFFLSRLFKRLKGERIIEADSTDPTFDRYLDASLDDGLSERLLAIHVPHMIDLEGNEENQGGSKGGNRVDFTMRPGSSTKVPIIRTLNALSGKIMGNVAPSDIDPANPIGMSEEAFNSLVLRDLQGDAEENRIMLNIKEQAQFLSNNKSTMSTEAAFYAQQVPSDVLMELTTDVDPTVMDSDVAGGLDLHKAIGVIEDSDSEDEDKTSHVGSKASFVDAQKQILEGVVARRAEIAGSGAGGASLSGLSQATFDRLVLTHATTTEFLHHFWVVFLSGDGDRAGELAKMVETLDRAMDRINAVAEEAEKERDDIVKKQRQKIRDVFEQTKKKISWSPNSVGGGRKVVMETVEPTIKSIRTASQQYRKALEAEGLS